MARDHGYMTQGSAGLFWTRRRLGPTSEPCPEPVDILTLPDGPAWTPDRPWLTDQTTDTARTGSHRPDPDSVSTTHRQEHP